jgi:predicted nucleic acid-binding Zn ribbon protein
MSKKNCSVCGLNEKACLHSLQLRDEKADLRVTKIFWFSVGFILALGVVFINFSAK